MGLYKRTWPKNGKRVTTKIWHMSYTVDGRQRCESTGTTNKRLAEKKLSIRLAEVAQGSYRFIPAITLTLRDWSEQFLKSVVHQNTKRSYTSCVKMLLEFFGEARLSQVTANRIEMFKQSRLEAETGPATINRNLAVLRRMMKIASRRRLVAHNPFEEVEFLSERQYRRQPHILTFEEEARLVTAAGPMLRALIILLVDSGLRIGREALPLKWTDIDFGKSAITIRESKTPAGRRPVPLSEYCIAELLRWRNLTGPELSEFVFFNPRHKARHLLKLPKTWASALKKARINHFPIYNLRHTFASRGDACGISTITLAQLIGHSSTAIVQTYAKVVDQSRRDAIKKLDEYRRLNQTKPDNLQTDVILQ
jgi:integrase